MQLTPEEQAALEWQARRIQRRSFQRSLQAALTPDPERAAQTKKNWAPLSPTGEIKGQLE